MIYKVVEGESSLTWCYERWCWVLQGGFGCGCPDGFRRHPYYSQCVDDDECSTATLCGAADCQNTLGSYKCLCPNGYSFNLNLFVCIQVSHTVVAKLDAKQECCTVMPHSPWLGYDGKSLPVQNAKQLGLLPLPAENSHVFMVRETCLWFSFTEWVETVCLYCTCTVFRFRSSVIQVWIII